ncbi:signal peptidase I [Cuneatibacter caecimuris]|uniref:Signal peptidase I n=1 Tax=Cuneatibacter caecimuris TaxID=1796618 RepID=A0A4Q7PMQ1_9FIRM|nr:signal peptidase I [Cuneatibacter caecimuris]RZT01180.1 Signal peptidase I [Cuneatibacter caecimuris]
MMKRGKTKPSNRICLLIRIISNGIILCTALISLGVLIGSALGYRAYVVLSSSMFPAYPTGCVVITQPVSFEDLSIGDTITFRSGPENSSIVTHRVASLNNIGVETKGDNNEYPDTGIVKAKDILGRVWFGIPNLGYLIQYIKEHPYLVILITCCILALYILLRTVNSWAASY